MKKTLWAILITILLFGIVIWEQIYIDNSLNTLIVNVNNVDTKITSSNNIDNDEIIELCNNLDNYWTNKEKVLCLFINHNDLSKVGEQIKKVNMLVLQNKKEECVIELDILKFYANNYSHVMKVNIQNIL